MKIDENLERLLDAISGLRKKETDPDSGLVDTVDGKTFLLIGLGNPGSDYNDTRHNIGFMVLDHMAEKYNVDFSRMKHKAVITEARHQGNKIILAKPQTFMNRSGESVKAIMKFYKIPLENLFVIYDDVDLDLGSLRIRPKGGAGGHKGMKSIIDHLGTHEFPRFRLGIGRPPGRMQAAGYVLQDFSDNEKDLLEITMRRAEDAIVSFMINGIQDAMTSFNRTID